MTELFGLDPPWDIPLKLLGAYLLIWLWGVINRRPMVKYGLLIACMWTGYLLAFHIIAFREPWQAELLGTLATVLTIVSRMVYRIGEEMLKQQHDLGRILDGLRRIRS